MTVDFNGIGNSQVNSPRTSADKGAAKQPAQPAPAEQAKAQAPAARGENVNLSKQAREIRQMGERLESTPEVDDSRVEQIRAALADGSYKVDAEKVAQKMLEMDESIFG
ncbi:MULTISPECIES: flagellar biosynthesis anti-sigma factor FlgM [Marinobacter]|uniref:Negative regulator of flagellin synthesis n=1 Tax=Marinobacter segnicrescens TaxID=430453 RepID=A0A1H9YA02_9GAMM|nr:MULTISPECIES: flagellar biosynthesis anti-sigma factor FlgM [Marinobacter]UZD64149.1 flagellar biosynthesis anti-sigma factor FlgM [Marinobacter sp. AN1]SES65763.1 anti-sigma-28 factor, FlgM family [Marinobacter segnicrescens]